MNEGGGKRVSGPDRVDGFDGEAGMLVKAFLGYQKATIRATGDADELRATEMEKPLGSKGLFAGRKRRGRVEQLKDDRQFFLIQLNDAGAPDGIGKDFPGEKRLAQINVENARGGGKRGSQEFVDGAAGSGRALGQRAKTDGGGLGGERAPLRSHLQRVPGGVCADFVARLTLRVDKNLYRACGMRWIGLQKVCGQAELLKPLLGFLAQSVVANAAGNDAVITEKAGDVGEVGRCSAKLLAGRKEVPEQFAEANDGEISVGHGSHLTLERRIGEKEIWETAGWQASNADPSLRSG